MEGQRLQADLDGLFAVHNPLLHPNRDVPVRPERGPDEDLREDRGLLSQAKVHELPVVRAWFLRVSRHDSMVGPVHVHSLAGLHSRVRVCHDTRERRARTTHEAHHHEVSEIPTSFETTRSKSLIIL